MVRYILLASILHIASIHGSTNVQAPLQEKGSNKERAIVGTVVTGVSVALGAIPVIVGGAAAVVTGVVVGGLALALGFASWWLFGTGGIMDFLGKAKDIAVTVKDAVVDGYNKVKDLLKEAPAKTSAVLFGAAGLVAGTLLSISAGVPIGTSLIFGALGAIGGAFSGLFGFGIYWFLCYLGFPTWFSAICGVVVAVIAFRLLVSYIQEKIEEAKPKGANAKTVSTISDEVNGWSWTGLVFGWGRKLKGGAKRLDAKVWEWVVANSITTIISCFGLLLVGGLSYSLYNKDKR